MTELILNKGLTKTKVLLYSDIDQLSAERFSKVNKYWMLHDELGGSFDDIDKIHITRLLLAVNDPEKMKGLIDNLRVLIHNIVNDINPESLSFACLIHSIDGVELTDLSDENLRKIIKYLSDRGLTMSTVKKKAKRYVKGYTVS